MHHGRPETGGVNVAWIKVIGNVHKLIKVQKVTHWISDFLSHNQVQLMGNVTEEH